MPGSLKKRAKKSRAPRRRLNPDARRSELLDAALCVLGKRNPTEVCVEDVTRAAGAAKGTFYRYFPSWNDLLLALREHLLSAYASDFRGRFAGLSPSNWWAGVESECVRFVDFVVGLGSLHYTIFHGPIADHPIDAEHSATTLITEMLKAGIAAGACRLVDVDVASVLLFAVLHATADGIARFGDRERRVEAMLGLLRGWLRNSQPTGDANIP